MKILIVDIGGTAMKYAFMDEKGSFLTRGDVPTPLSGREEFLQTLETLFRTESDVCGLALSLPGTVDYETGTLKNGGSLTYNYGFPLRSALEERILHPVVLENDGKCAALAEATYGALSDVRDGIVLVFGTNIGGGIVIDGKVHRGIHGAAGEVTYIIPNDDGPAVENLFGERCGVPGLLHLYAVAYRKRAEEEGTFDQTLLGRREGLDLTENADYLVHRDVPDGKSFFQRWEEGDPVAREALDTFTERIATQIFNLQNVLDPERFAIGGGISAQPVFIESIREHLARLYQACPRAVSFAEVVPCRFQNDANLYGALATYLQVHKNPS